MVRRFAAGVLWFFTVAWGWNYVVLVLGLPSFLGLALGAAVGVLVWADPLQRLWQVAQDVPAHQDPGPTPVPGALVGRI